MHSTLLPALFGLVCLLPICSQAQVRDWNGHRYEVIWWKDRVIVPADHTSQNLGFTWHVANIDSMKRGKHLVTITSAEEWNVVKEIWFQVANEHDYSLVDSAIGLRPPVCDADYTWVTGEAYSYKIFSVAFGDLKDTLFFLAGGKTRVDVVNKIGADPLADFYDFYISESESDTDSDGDGLSDFRETEIFKTNPLVSDTDGDGFSDGLEVLNGSNPLVVNSASIPTTKPIVVRPAIELEIIAPKCEAYQLQVSSDLTTWENVGQPLPGNGDLMRFFVRAEEGHRYHRLVILAEPKPRK